MRYALSPVLLGLMAIAATASACATAADDEGDGTEATDSNAEALRTNDLRKAAAACVKHAGLLVSTLARPTPPDPADGDDDASDPILERRGRRAFNDRRLHGLGANGRACADCHM